MGGEGCRASARLAPAPPPREGGATPPRRENEESQTQQGGRVGFGYYRPAYFRPEYDYAPGNEGAA